MDGWAVRRTEADAHFWDSEIGIYSKDLRTASLIIRKRFRKQYGHLSLDKIENPGIFKRSPPIRDVIDILAAHSRLSTSKATFPLQNRWYINQFPIPFFQYCSQSLSSPRQPKHKPLTVMPRQAGIISINFDINQLKTLPVHIHAPPAEKPVLPPSPSTFDSFHPATNKYQWTFMRSVTRMWTCT